MWVGDGGGGGGDLGHYVVDAVRFELISPRGDVISSTEVSTASTCQNGPSP